MAQHQTACPVGNALRRRSIDQCFKRTHHRIGRCGRLLCDGSLLFASGLRRRRRCRAFVQGGDSLFDSDTAQAGLFLERLFVGGERTLLNMFFCHAVQLLSDQCPGIAIRFLLLRVLLRFQIEISSLL